MDENDEINEASVDGFLNDPSKLKDLKSSEELFQPANFETYVTSLILQTTIFLGEIPHPVTQEIVKNKQQAKLLLETLILLKEKMVGNLTHKENTLLESAISELKQKYVNMEDKE